MLKILEEKNSLKAQMRLITEELRQTREAKTAVESTLENEIEGHHAIMEDRRHTRERTEKLCKHLTTIGAIALGYPEEEFNQALKKAVTTLDNGKRERDDLIAANQAYARDLLGLRADVQRKQAEIVKNRLRDGRGDKKLFQLTLDLKDNAYRRLRDCCEDEIKYLGHKNDCVKRERDDFKVERDDLRAERDNLKAERDAVKMERDTLKVERDDLTAKQDASLRRSDHDGKETRLQHRAELDKMALAQKKLETTMQAGEQHHRMEQIKWEKETAGLRGDITALQGKLAKALQTILRQSAPNAGFADSDTVMGNAEAAFIGAGVALALPWEDDELL